MPNMMEVGLPLRDLDTPALWINLARMERNIAALAAEFRQAGVYWRPHTKGIKTPALAGGAIFCDQSYQAWGVPLEPALFVHTTTTSRPTDTRIICDAGFKTSPRGFSPPKPVDFDVHDVVLSAEHGIIRLPEPAAQPQVGETFDMLVGYGDATICLHDIVYGVRDGMVEAVWEIAGRGKLR